MSNLFDVLIVGGGMTGASLACALSDLPIKVGLIEAITPTTQIQADYDNRSVALSYGSQTIFAGLGVWPALAKWVTPIQQIHISDRGHFGATRLHASSEKVPALGYVIEVPAFNAVLNQALAERTSLPVIC